jgi:MFS family permease
LLPQPLPLLRPSTAPPSAAPCPFPAPQPTRLPKPFAYLFVGTALAGVVGAPLATGLLALDGKGGLHGYQWLFILEGAPAVLLGAAVFFLLPDTPSEVKGLKASEVAALEADLAAEARAQEERLATPAKTLIWQVVRGKVRRQASALWLPPPLPYRVLVML